VSFSRCPTLVAGCTDSSSSSGRTRLWGERRKSGGTQEHAASAPHRCETARTDRKAFAAAITEAASPCEKRIDPPAPGLSAREQIEGRCSRTGRVLFPQGSGTTRMGRVGPWKNVRPVLRQGFAFAIRVLPAVASGLLFGQKSRTGRCEVPFIDYPTRQLTAPRPTYPWPLMVMGQERRSCHGQMLPRERRSLGTSRPGLLTGLDFGGCGWMQGARRKTPCATEQPSS